LKLLLSFAEADDGENHANRNEYQVNIYRAGGGDLKSVPPGDPQQDPNKDKRNARPELIVRQP